MNKIINILFYYFVSPLNPRFPSHFQSFYFYFKL